MKKTPLLELETFGQSLWLDYIRRSLLTSGELKKMIEEDGVKGITSNPTIFEKAIAGSSDYNEAMKKLAAENKNVEEIYSALVLEDIGHAADEFFPVYRKTNGQDGFVSIEVSPELAQDTEKTIQEARKLSALLDRSNVMIKVPGTPAGIPAIEQLISDGINVNVTLLFNLDNYEQVMEAYLKGLEKRVQQGKPLDAVNSVASFFVSRVDTAVDKLLSNKIQRAKDSGEKAKLESLLGKAAVANAKMAYQRFKKVFSSPRFEVLKNHGANVQRPLWASTSTKNPAYSDILYVQELIAKDSVNTMPPETIQNFKDHGKPRLTIEDKLQEAEAVLKHLAELGIDLKQVTHKLQEEGVKAFSDSFEKLIHCIAEKREEYLKGLLDHQIFHMGAYQAKIDVKLKELEKNHFGKRFWEKDAALWKNAKEPKNWMGWLNINEIMKGQIERIQDFAQTIRAEKYQDLVLLGMGGSSLFPDVLRSTFGRIEGYPQLHVLDTTDPASISSVEKKINLDKTLFIVSSKSGGTLEVSSLFQYFWGKISRGENFIAITDPATSLEDLALKKKFRQVFLNPPDIGGRYSALSYFGIVPAGLIGLDLKKLLDAADQMVQSCVSYLPLSDNPAAVLGTTFGELWKIGKDKITLIIPKPLHSFGGWLEQLLAESTGKSGKGLIPIDGEPVGSPDVYGLDRIFVYLHLRRQHDEALSRKVQAIESAGHPVIHITLENPYDLAEEVFRWEFATAVAGAVMEIDPFDQPNVQESKDNTKEVLEQFKKTGNLREDQGSSGEKEIKQFCDQIKSGDYLAFMAYFERTPGHDEKLEAIRIFFRNRFKSATTLGYGPRFLHSTGQLHKGGANNGVFIQFTAEDEKDLPIPGAFYGFSTLKKAQAIGDYHSLLKHKRRVLHFPLGKDIAKGLERFLNLVEEALAVKRQSRSQ
jgi:transaldolase/glucose-6-phosphate isomerase